MPYWGHRAAECDYAFDAVGAYAFIITERMLEDAATVIAERYPEQGIVASVRCLRLLDAGFPKCVRLHFGKKELRQARELFGKWYAAVEDAIPAEYRSGVRAEADAEFSLYEQQLRS